MKRREFIALIGGSAAFSQTEVSLRRTGSVALGGIADIGRTPLACRCEAIDPSRTLAAKIAVTHNAALW